MNQAVSPIPLAQSFTLPNGVIIKNRLVKSAMSEVLATMDNHVTPALARLYGRWAQGGSGLLITGSAMIDRRAIGEPGNVVVEDESDLPLLRDWARAGTANGTSLWMQINHPGKQSPKGLNKETVAPSAIPFGNQLAAFFGTPRALTDAEITDIIKRFGNTARIAKKAGFSGVQIHAAHGYLISQFLSPLHNIRTDRWGGSEENRRRFVLEVYAEIRRQVGPEFPIGIKLNSADFQRGGFTEEESLDVIRALDAAGIDMIEVSGGNYEAPVFAGTKQGGQKASTVAREAYFLEFAEKARAVIKTPLMVTGGFRSVAGMNEALRSGSIDFVGIARLLAIEPNAPLRLLMGQDPQQEVKPIKTGINIIDNRALMEVYWYTRQLKRLANGKNAKPHESALWSLANTLLGNVFWGTVKTRRLRA